MSAIAIGDASACSPEEALSAALRDIGFWKRLKKLCGRRSAKNIRIVIKPDMAGFEAQTPLATDPLLVETFIDLLHDRGYIAVAIGCTADNTSLWSENREVFALSELLGYRYVTPKGRSYDIADLAEQLGDGIFPQTSTLHETKLSTIWSDADVRIVFCKNRTDEKDGYSLCLNSLIGVLPLPDKDLHYRESRDPGEVVADLLQAAPVHFAFIDALTSAHDLISPRPSSLQTNTLIAATDPVLADYIGSIKMGLDPYQSKIFGRCARAGGLPSHYQLIGSTAVYPDWINIPPLHLKKTKNRTGADDLHRLLQPWLQKIDPELFALKHPVDAHVNKLLETYVADAQSSTVGTWSLVVLNILLSLAGNIANSYATLFDKDALKRRNVSLGLDLSIDRKDEFHRLVEELHQIKPIARDAPEAAPGLQWRTINDTIYFVYTRHLPIDFEQFVEKVPVDRTIQFMNDYLGGVVVPITRDERGRSVLQAERNLYLPQPNYLVLYNGKPIDVTKLEVVEYRKGRHRLYWKTIHSENQSAEADDGIATFEADEDGTLVTIMGKQRFLLPPFWQMLDLNLIPKIKHALVTHAYRTFFDRTIANFEALVEGRDIQLGRKPGEQPALDSEGLLSALKKIADTMFGDAGQVANGESQRAGAASAGIADADGFVHFTPSPSSPSSHGAMDQRPAPQQGLSRLIKDLTASTRLGSA